MPEQKWYHKIFSVIRRKKKVKEDETEDQMKKTVETDEDQEQDGKKLSFRERRKAKKARKKLRPLWKRVTIQILKTVLMRIPITVVVLVIIIGAFLNYYLSAPTVQELAKKNFNNMSYGNLDLKVRSFNIFRGFEMEDILIRNGEEFKHTKFVYIKRVVLKYNIFDMFTGSVRFPEIGIYQPRVYLKQDGEKWNFARLMKPSPEKAVEPEEEKEELKEKSDSKEINLPIAVDFLLNFKLEDLQVYAKGNDFSGEMKGLTFGMNINIPPFKRIPLSVEAVNIIKTMRIELNPKNSMELKYNSSGLSTQPDLTLMWKLIFENGDKSHFVSKLDLGSRRLPLRLKNRYLTPLNFFVKYDVIYQPKTDRLDINNFSVTFKNRNWIKLAGVVEEVTKDLKIDISMTESDISLTDLYPYYVTLTGDRKTRFRGGISLYPLIVKGTLNKQSISGAVKMGGISFRIPGTSAKLPSSAIHYRVYRNNSYISLDSDISLNSFSYVLQGSKSGLNTLKLETSLSSPDNFRSVKVSKLDIDFLNPVTRRSALEMKMNTSVRLAPSLKGEANITKFRFNKSPLVTMVPLRLKKQIESIPLKKDVNLKLDSKFSIAGALTGASLNLYASIPDYKVTDLVLKTSVLQNNSKKTVKLNYLNLGSKSQNLQIKASGFVALKKAPISDSDIKVSVELNNKKDRSVFGPWMSRGRMLLTAAVKGDLATGNAKGKLKFDDFNIYNKEAKTYLTGLDMNFPFNFDFEKQKNGSSQLLVTQKNIIESSRYDSRPNLSIKSLKSKHPARDMSYEYMKNLRAHMSFNNRVFSISNMKADIMEGALYGRTILFNLADFKPENMEFNLIMDATNIDLSLLDDPNPKKKSTSAELSLSSNFSGRGLDIGKELTADGYINIYEIGTKTANTLMKGLSVEKGQSKLGTVGQFAVDNSMLVKNFDFRLKNGLIYTTVNLSRKILSALITVDNSEVVFNRITVQEYLRNIMKNGESKK